MGHYVAIGDEVEEHWAWAVYQVDDHGVYFHQGGVSPTEKAADREILRVISQ